MTRKVAELDEVVTLTTRRVWAVLAAVLVLFGALAAWGLLARVESTVELHGVLVAGEGPSVVTAPAAATVVSVPPAGSRASAGGELVVLEVDGQRRVVTSPVAGAVSSVAVRAGSQVSGGSVLATVEPSGARLGAILLLDAGTPAVVTVGAPVRGAGLTGRVTAVEPYPVRADELATRLGQPSLGGDGARLVRAVHVDFGVPARAGATLTPVTLDLVLGDRSPADLLRHGGA